MTTLKTTKINIQDLKPAEYNPRIMQTEEQEKLKQGLTTFGLVDPIIIDLTDNNTVIGGHQRLEILKQLNPDTELLLIKLGDIGLVIKETDLKIKDKNDQKALNLALNKINGDWDYKKLDDLLLSLNEDNYNIELTGFNEKELLNIEPLNIELDNNNNPEETIEIPDEKEIKTPKQSNIKTGDIFQLGQHKLICGDSTKQETYELLFDGEKADTTFTSPPYNTLQGHKNNPTPTKNSGYDTYYNINGLTNQTSVYDTIDDNLTDTEYTDLLNNSLQNALRYTDNVLYNIGILRGSKKGIINLLYTNKDQFLDILIWEKQRAFPLGLKTQQKMVSHRAELIFCFNHKGNRNFNHAQWKQGTKDNIINTDNASQNKDSKIHNATFPLELPIHILTFFTNKSILDNFAGTGTTLIAAEQCNKKSYNIEQSPQYCEHIIKRWENLTNKKAEKIN